MKNTLTPPRDSEGRLLRPGHQVRVFVAGTPYRGSLLFVLAGRPGLDKPIRVAIRLDAPRPRLVWVPARKTTVLAR